MADQWIGGLLVAAALLALPVTTIVFYVQSRRKQ